MNRNAAIASTGAPRSSHSWRMCARGSSPRKMATTGLRNPSPTRDDARMMASIDEFTRGKRGFAGAAAFAGVAGTAAADAATTAGSTPTLRLLADDISVLDLLLALEPERQLLDVCVRLAAVVLDAVDEILG